MSQPGTVASIAEEAARKTLTIAVAESLTCGAIVSALGAGPDAQTWLRGGVVAYAPEVKFDLLGVTPGPVVSQRCADEMARGVARVLGAEIGIAVTGVGGPGPDEGQPAGTVYLAAARGEEIVRERLQLPGAPEEVIALTVTAALAMLDGLLERS
jgi:nicotinamide-nucleotide amidase